MTPPSVQRQTSQDLSVAVAEAIADHEGIDPIRLEPPLNCVLDLDALDRLFRNRQNAREDSTCHVQFGYGRHLVTVYPDGTVDVE